MLRSQIVQQGEAVLAGHPSAGLRLPHQPYMVKEGWELLLQQHSNGALLVPGHVIQHVSEELQDRHRDIGVIILEHVYDARQEGLHFSCLYQRQSFPLAKAKPPPHSLPQPSQPTAAPLDDALLTK